MKTVNFNNLLIISFICFFFLGCSSTQLVDISKDEQLKDLLDNIGQVELKINANEDVKQLIVKSIGYNMTGRDHIIAFDTERGV